MTNEQILIIAAGALALIFLAAWILAARKAAKWRSSAENAARQKEFLLEKHEQETRHAKLLYDQECAHHKQELEQLQASHAREKQEQESRWNESRKALLEQFSNLATQTLAERSKELKQTNEEKMTAIVNPLKEKLQELGKAVADARVAEAKNKISLEERMNAMMEQTNKIGTDAVNLTKALRGDSKMQGDWGEMILERILETSGFIRGKHFTTQTPLKDEKGNHYRADVTINLPDNRHVIVDSKVSLTAYVKYTEAQDDDARHAALNEHVASVRKHINELAEKDYARLDPHCIGYVLMFVPNEASYIAAVQAAPELQQEALSRKLLLISPTNLLMALQLADNMWVNATQMENIQNIINQAEKLYTKFANFQDAFEKMGDSLSKANDAFTQASNRLYHGRGNYISLVDKLRSQMGIKPNARLKVKEDNAEPALEDVPEA